MDNTLLIRAIPAGAEYGNKFKLADNTGVLHKDGTLTGPPKTYDTADEALTAGDELLAVGQFYNGQAITRSERTADGILLTFA